MLSDILVPLKLGHWKDDQLSGRSDELTALVVFCETFIIYLPSRPDYYQDSIPSSITIIRITRKFVVRDPDTRD